MNECHRFEERIRDLLAGELAPPERDSLFDHASRCDDCGRILDAHLELARAGEEIPEPGEAEFRLMRMSVLARAARRRARGRRGAALPFLRPVAVGALAAAALVAFFFVGRWSAAPRAWSESVLAEEIGGKRLELSGTDSFWDSPYAFTNVSARRRVDGMLDLSFDVSRHVDLVTAEESALAREALLHAILAPSSVGSRLGAMNLSGEIPDDRLKEALIFTLHNDRDMSVRLKALAILKDHAYDPAIRDAFLETLRNDESVSMRLDALDYLASRRVSPETLMKTIEEARQETDNAVILRAVELTFEPSPSRYQ